LWLFPVNLTDMNNRSVLVLAIDTTERKQAELALVEAERLTAIGRMSASLAHEINNPIQSVVGCLGLAMEVLENGQDASQFMDVAMDELIRASQIVKRLRDLGKSHESEKRPADVQESLNRVLLLTRKKAQDQGVTIQWETQESPPDVMMDPDRIAQVFLNLVLNAIESMSEGGDLAVSVHPTDDPEGVRIAFKDTGVGIPPDQLERMFEAFHSTKQMGLGLGLYVSRKIIQDHRGEIWVESEVGQGSTFTVWLPKA
jgi:signal transduction histidine kinase